MIEATCITCGADFTPAPDAFRHGTWRTCTRCRDGPGEQASGVTLDDSRPVDAILEPPYCQAERTNTMTTFAQMQELRMREQREQAEAIAAERQATFDRGVAARAAERKPTDDRIAQEKETRANAREQATRDLARRAAEDRETELRVRFDKRFPGGSDADFRVLRPQLLAEIGVETEASIAGMRAHYRSMV